MPQVPLVPLRGLREGREVREGTPEAADGGEGELGAGLGEVFGEERAISDAEPFRSPGEDGGVRFDGEPAALEGRPQQLGYRRG